MFDWYLKVLRQYADFEGRARRSEYWYFVLVNILVYVPLYLVARLVDGPVGIIAACLYALYALVLVIPSLAVKVRRLHDIDRSGWWILIGFIPLVGGIILLIWECEDSYPDNEWGPNPKEEAFTPG